MIWLEIGGGFLLLLLGGELLVRGAVGCARRFGVSPLLIGLTLVGFGTSTPELLTSLQAALAGSPGVAVGNVVGSNIANILLILGAAALIQPIAVPPQALYRDGGMMLAATLVACSLAWLGSVERWFGAGMLAALAAYVVWSYRRERARPDAGAELHLHEAAAVGDAGRPLWRSGLEFAVGLGLTLYGARLLVTGAIELAGAAGISEAVIGLTVVAVGTSLPELATSVMAARRRQADVAIGNVVGSNIFNILGILGTTAVVQPIPVPAEILRFDLWVMLAVALLLLAFAWTGRRICQLEAGFLLAGYGAYLAVLARPW